MLFLARKRRTTKLTTSSKVLHCFVLYSFGAREMIHFHMHVGRYLLMLSVRMLNDTSKVGSTFEGRTYNCI